MLWRFESDVVLNSMKTSLTVYNSINIQLWKLRII